MSLRSLSIVVVLVLLAAFAALNWTTFTTPTELSLLFGSVYAPLGVVLLGFIAALCVLFLLFIVYLQTSVLLESRRHAREMQSQRELADHAEASRFTDLRAYLEKELTALRVAMEAGAEQIGARVALAERTLRDEVEQSANGLAAHIGEIEERFEQGRQQT